MITACQYGQKSAKWFQQLAESTTTFNSLWQRGKISQLDFSRLQITVKWFLFFYSTQFKRLILAAMAIIGQKKPKTKTAGHCSSAISAGCQSTVYLICQYANFPHLFTLNDNVKFCERSPIWVDGSVKFTSMFCIFSYFKGLTSVQEMKRGVRRKRMSGKEGKQRHNENIHVKLLNSQTTTVLKTDNLVAFANLCPVCFFMD